MDYELVPPEYEAVSHILESPLIAERCAPYIGEDDFDWAGLFAISQTMSGGEQLLIRIAYDLWTSTGVVGIWEISRGLDQAGFERVLAALRMCRGEYRAPSPALLAAACKRGAKRGNRNAWNDQPRGLTDRVRHLAAGR